MSPIVSLACRLYAWQRQRQHWDRRTLATHLSFLDYPFSQALSPSKTSVSHYFRWGCLRRPAPRTSPTVSLPRGLYAWQRQWQYWDRRTLATPLSFPTTRLSSESPSKTAVLVYHRQGVHDFRRRTCHILFQ
jgi:hypothetical protein